MAALVISILVVVAGVGLALFVGRRRPIGTPLTWGEAFVAGTFVFALMVVAYGIAPHQWLDFADNELLWRKDKMLIAISGEGIKLGETADQLGGAGRILVNYEVLRDFIAAGLYVAFFAGQLVLWAWWQRRGKKRPQLELTSAYARPVIKKA